MTVAVLPTVNAVLNASAAVAMLAGFVAIRQGRVAVHRACMLTAVGLSILFLCSYLVYHAQVGSRPYTGGGWLRTLYFAILLSHTVLAVADRADGRRRRSTGPCGASSCGTRGWRASPCLLWLYVSVTGVVVYWMLYHG